MNNYFIIGKVNEGKSYLFNLFSKTHKTISNPKANTTIDVIRKNIGNIKIKAIENAKIFLIKLLYCFTEPKVNPLTKCL